MTALVRPAAWLGTVVLAIATVFAIAASGVVDHPIGPDIRLVPLAIAVLTASTGFLLYRWAAGKSTAAKTGFAATPVERSDNGGGVDEFVAEISLRALAIPALFAAFVVVCIGFVLLTVFGWFDVLLGMDMTNPQPIVLVVEFFISFLGPIVALAIGYRRAVTWLRARHPRIARHLGLI